VNELTTPNSTVNNDIEINVYVSMGDDFEVAVPDNHFANFVLKPQSGDLLDTQAGEIVPESQNTVELDAPQQSASTIVGLPPAEDSNLNKVFFGEAISSFRPMLKRFALWNTIPKVNLTPTVISGRFSMFPYLRGNVPNAVDITAALADYNYVNTVLLHWVKFAFSGWRGTIRYKLIPRGFSNRGDRIDVQRSRYTRGDVQYYLGRQVLDPYSGEKEARYDLVQHFNTGSGTLPGYRDPMPGNMGTAVALNSVNGVLEVEIPYYSWYRFSPGKTVDYTGPQNWEAPWDYRVYYPGDEPNCDTATTDVYVAGGEDLQFYFFTGLPRMYYESAPPLYT
jgi:hypothetical protein